MINNKKPTVQTSWEKNQSFSKGLSKIEGILTSSFQLKGTRTNQPYYYGFFALEGISDQDIPIIFKVDSSDTEPTPPDIPPQAKVILEGH